jgi:hypothetical protein
MTQLIARRRELHVQFSYTDGRAMGATEDGRVAPRARRRPNKAGPRSTPLAWAQRRHGVVAADPRQQARGPWKTVVTGRPTTRWKDGYVGKAGRLAPASGLPCVRRYPLLTIVGGAGMAFRHCRRRLFEVRTATNPSC